MKTIRALALLAATIAGPAMAGPATAQAAMSPADPTGTTLDVTAEGRTTRVPDVATIRAGVVSQGATAAAALADNAGRMTRVLAALRAASIAPRDVQTATVSLQPQYRYADGQPPVVTGYQASNSVAVRFRDIAKAGAILDTLVVQGANQIDGPSLEIDQPDAALDEARADAVKRAQARAQLYARAAGLQVARIVSIAEAGQDEGSGPRPPMIYARAQSVAKTAVEPGERAITATLQVRFLLR